MPTRVIRHVNYLRSSLLLLIPTRPKSPNNPSQPQLDPLLVVPVFVVVLVARYLPSVVVLDSGDTVFLL